jgi:hypothetical protein
MFVPSLSWYNGHFQYQMAQKRRFLTCLGPRERTYLGARERVRDQPIRPATVRLDALVATTRESLALTRWAALVNCDLCQIGRSPAVAVISPDCNQSHKRSGIHLTAFAYTRNAPSRAEAEKERHRSSRRSSRSRSRSRSRSSRNVLVRRTRRCQRQPVSPSHDDTPPRTPQVSSCHASEAETSAGLSP